MMEVVVEGTTFQATKNVFIPVVVLLSTVPSWFKDLQRFGKLVQRFMDKQRLFVSIKTEKQTTMILSVHLS